MKRKLMAMIMACAMIVAGFGGLAPAPAAWASEDYDSEFEKEAEAYWEGIKQKFEQERQEQQDYWDWYNNLPYAEQMKLLEQDLEREGQAREQEKARAAAEAAAQAAKPITLKVGGVTVKTDSPPVIENGRTLAPVRAIVEALGYIVAWDSATQTMEVYNYYTEALVISMKIGSKVAKVAVGTGSNAIMDDRILDVPAKIINGRTMVPVRFIAETLGCEVSWDQTTKAVNIIQAEG
ncbi:MAG TPA: copper amine oxidase N-terminal domain-containing protein [Syntrophomonas sp.]|nr:copper amine oxidase N-terminal domain-containing protein [Syntrophomonas sp.]